MRYLTFFFFLCLAIAPINAYGKVKNKRSVINRPILKSWYKIEKMDSMKEISIEAKQSYKIFFYYGAIMGISEIYNNNPSTNLTEELKNDINAFLSDTDSDYMDKGLDSFLKSE